MALLRSGMFPWAFQCLVESKAVLMLQHEIFEWAKVISEELGVEKRKVTDPVGALKEKYLRPSPLLFHPQNNRDEVWAAQRLC
ncbi:hypothetical protein Nmel_015804 [Mimus melanotis]